MTTLGRIFAMLSCWLVVALIVGASGILEVIIGPPIQIILFSLTAALLALYWRNAGLRARIDSLPIKGLVALHLGRTVGFYFLYLYSRGELPYDFAVKGGWGDIVVALLAALVILIPLRGVAGRTILVLWNAIGLADILFVVVTAGRIGLSDPQALIPLTHLPLALLPTFYVPIIIASHIIIFARLKTNRV